MVEVKKNDHVTWEVTVLPGFYARHTYFMEDLGNDRTRFGSWEQAMGPSFRLLKRFWLAHFAFVKDRSLHGVRFLEQIYRRTGRIDDQVLEPRDYLPLVGAIHEFLLRPIQLLLPSYVELTPGVYAALGGGGNSLVVYSGGSVLLVDSKFPPFASQLRKWIERNTGSPVKTVVNTHYHYDHTQGNHLYSDARIIAQKEAPCLMEERDGKWWHRHPGGVPKATDLIDETVEANVGGQTVVVNPGGQGHTATDLWIHLRRGDLDIIATGDVASLGVYPFFDMGQGVQTSPI